MAEQRDAIIVGGGHNGLVAAFYLAQAGMKPLVLERRPIAGGLATTEEFHPGFKCSTLAHAAGPLRSDIARDMQLERHGLEVVQPDPRVVALTPDGRALILYNDSARSVRELSKFSKKDSEALPEFQRDLGRFASVVACLLAQTPPDIDQPTASDIWNALKSFRKFRSLGKKDMLRLLRWAPMAVADLVEEWFESEPLKAVLAARGVFGTFLGPRSAGSSAVMLMRAAADPHPAGAAWFVKGGLGALTQAMAAAAKEAGAEIRTNAEVASVIVRNETATGVVLANGEEISAKLVVSNADPKRTFLQMVGAEHLEPNFVIKMRNYRSMGTVAKVNLALSGLPGFTALRDSGGTSYHGTNGHPLAGRIHVGPEMDYLERAFDCAKYGEFSREPYLEITIPTLTDPSLAPPNRHVMSIYVQYAPYKLRQGNWSEQRGALGDAVVKTLSAHAPNLDDLILHCQVITPLDLEETYGLTGGHIFHGELSLDQLYTMRPLLGWARYRTPIRGLYLCGSGTHPSTGLTGASGANAAREILKDWRKIQ